MKILQVTTHLNIGGIANYIFTLSKSMQAKGVETILASSGGSLIPELEKSGMKHIGLDIKTKFEFSPKVFISAFRLAAIAREENVDIIHAHTRVSQVAALIASKLTGIPYITTCHGYFKLRSRSFIDTWGDAVIAISDAVSKHLERDLKVKRPRIELIYSGVQTAQFSGKYSESERSALRSALGLKDGPVVGNVGRLSVIKGHRFLISAMAEVLKSRPDAQCLIVGEGEERPALSGLAGNLGIEKSVRFAAADLDTPKYLSIMDVFVFPSVKEGLGIALLEAMAAGKACVASDIGGIADIIKDRSVGILVPVGDIKGLADSVRMLLDNEALRRDMGSRSAALVAEKFSLDVMADKVIQSYKKVISAKNK